MIIHDHYTLYMKSSIS